jgi:hypothetical protein
VCIFFLSNRGQASRPALPAHEKTMSNDNVIYLPNAKAERGDAEAQSEGTASTWEIAYEETYAERLYKAIQKRNADYVRAHADDIWVLATGETMKSDEQRMRQWGLVVIDLDLKLSVYEDYQRRWFLSENEAERDLERAAMPEWERPYCNLLCDEKFYLSHQHRLVRGGEWARFVWFPQYKGVTQVPIICLQTYPLLNRVVAWPVIARYLHTDERPYGKLEYVDAEHYIELGQACPTNTTGEV